MYKRLDPTYIVQIWYSARHNQLYLVYHDFMSVDYKDYCYLFGTVEPDTALIISINRVYNLLKEQECQFIDAYEAPGLSVHKYMSILDDSPRFYKPAIVYNEERDVLAVGEFDDMRFILENDGQFRSYHSLYAAKLDGWEIIGGLND